MICLLTIEREIGEGKEINKNQIKGGFTASLQEFWHRGRTFVKNKNLSQGKNNKSTSEQNIQVVPKSGSRSTI